MSYGLYDGDIQFYSKVPFFNLELMKISSYYKRKREIVNLSPKFTPNLYSNFIVRQDYPGFNQNYIGTDKISYGGRAFDGEKYKPLPIEIEKSKPDVFLYNKLESNIVTNKHIKSVFSTMRRAEHLRLSLDEKNIWEDYESQIRHDNNAYGIIFHDYNLNAINGAYDFVKEFIPKTISSLEGRRIGMKFPAQVDTNDEFLKWLTLPPMGNFYSLQYNGIIPMSLINELLEIRQNSSTLNQTSMCFTKKQNYDTFIQTGIVQLFETILDLRMKRLNFLLIYDKNFFIDNEWKEVIDLIISFNNHIRDNLPENDYYHRVAPYETFYSYIKSLTKKHIIYGSRLSKETAQRLFQFVRENNYNLFVDFYEYTGEEK